MRVRKRQAHSANSYPNIVAEGLPNGIGRGMEHCGMTLFELQQSR